MVVESIAFSVLFGFGWEFVFAFGGVVYDACENDGSACCEGSACPIAMEGRWVSVCEGCIFGRLHVNRWERDVEFNEFFYGNCAYFR